MSARDRYRTIFGKISSLEELVPWTAGLSNLVEFLAWDTRAVLGISKTDLWKEVIRRTGEPDCKHLPTEAKIAVVDVWLKQQLADSNSKDRYTGKRTGYCSPSEALRRNKFFSENYLNKEFDIFLSLCSDRYIDLLYGRFFEEFKTGGTWSTHGNSVLFENSLNLTEMHMDNLAYNAEAGVLVANELKLGGSRNKDQILKYCYLFKKLLEQKSVELSCSFLLLFISERKESVSWQTVVDQEIEHCKGTGKGKGNGKVKSHLLEPEVVQLRDRIRIDQLTWDELIEFNKKFVDRLGPEQQVERKLISGFTSALLQKDAIVRARGEEVESSGS